MRSLANEIKKHYKKQFAARVTALNDWAALYGELTESYVGGEPYIGYNAIVLSEAERDELVKVSESFGRIMTKAMVAIVEAGPEVYRRLGWPELLDYALRYEPPNRYLTLCGRFDFAHNPSEGWQILEYNSDTPSGSQEVTVVEERLFKQLAKLAPVARLNLNIEQDLVQAFYEEALFAPVPYGVEEEEGPRLPPRVGFITQARYLADLAQVEYYANRLRQKGIECVVGDLLNLSMAGDSLLLMNQPIDAIWRLYQIEKFARAPIFMAYTQANIIGSLKCLNNLRGFLAQSKAVLAWIWQERNNSQIFSEEEQATIAQNLPETHLLADLPENFDYSGYIIKEFYGREGAEVYNGATLSHEEWLQCRQWGTFVAQRRIELASLPHLVLNEQNEAEIIEAFPCVGSFIIADKWGGCYSRIGAKITNYQAQFIPTLVETP